MSTKPEKGKMKVYTREQKNPKEKRCLVIESGNVNCVFFYAKEYFNIKIVRDDDSEIVSTGVFFSYKNILTAICDRSGWTRVIVKDGKGFISIKIMLEEFMYSHGEAAYYQWKMTVGDSEKLFLVTEDQIVMSYADNQEEIY